MSRSNQAARHAIRDEYLTRPLTVRPTIEPTDLRPITRALAWARLWREPIGACRPVHIVPAVMAIPGPRYHEALTYFRTFIEPLAA